MDAFSLAIAYGTNNLKKIKIITISLFVGLFHYFMPSIGSMIGNQFFNNFIKHSNIIVGIIFIILAIEMILSIKEEKNIKIDNIIEIIIFSLTVSIDSFSVGVALGITKANILLCSIIFSITSLIFTFIGLMIGKYLNKKYGEKSTIIGIIILFIISLKYIFM